MKYRAIKYPDEDTLIKYLESIQISKKDISDITNSVR